MNRIILAGLVLLVSLPAHATTVVELFQSQGCSSCPPAIANVNALTGRPDILPLMFAVTYWDRLGWKDTFAKPEYTNRQVVYGRKFGDGAYTPEVVINGKADLVGADRSQLQSAIAKASPLEGPPVTLGADGVTVGSGKGDADIWFVRYDPRIQNVDIGAGENSGVSIAHKNIVRVLVRLGGWSGTPLTLKLPAGGDPAWRSAVLVQARNGGPILSALAL